MRWPMRDARLRGHAYGMASVRSTPMRDTLIYIGWRKGGSLRVSVMGKLIIKEAPVTNFDDKKPEFLDVTQAIYLEAYGYNSALTPLLKHSLTIQRVLQRQSLSLVWATPTTTATSSSSDLIGNHRSDGPEK
jgi:hypothetical protein